MNALEVCNVTKTFGDLVAVDNLSFQVKRGEIFGLLGPNGAGKTTTIRMALDILRPDQGEIRLLGGPVTAQVLDCVGYLPEERGLYRNVSVVDCLSYLAALKGMALPAAREQAMTLLERVNLAPNAHQKVGELSRGMQQKAQFVATIVHNPELVIVDEPFVGLDPVNTRLIKSLIYELRDQGKTVVMSTHMMHQVEEMCDRLLMIHHGRAVLYGTLDEVRARYAANAVIVAGQGDWASLPGVSGVEADGRNERETRLFLSPGVAPQDLLRQVAARPDMTIDRFEVALPSLDDIFIAVVEGTQ